MIINLRIRSINLTSSSQKRILSSKYTLKYNLIIISNIRNNFFWKIIVTQLLLLFYCLLMGGFFRQHPFVRVVLGSLDHLGSVLSVQHYTILSQCFWHEDVLWVRYSFFQRSVTYVKFFCTPFKYFKREGKFRLSVSSRSLECRLILLP